MKTWQRFLHSPHAAWLTHGSLLALTALYAWILLALPFWVALLPGVLVGHRIGVLLHEYLHGTAFRRYRHNLDVFTLWDGLMLLFGGFEIFRASHLAHHRHLNTPQEELIPRDAAGACVGGFWRELELVKHFVYLADALRGRVVVATTRHKRRRFPLALKIHTGQHVAGRVFPRLRMAFLWHRKIFQIGRAHV